MELVGMVEIALEEVLVAEKVKIMKMSDVASVVQLVETAAALKLLGAMGPTRLCQAQEHYQLTYGTLAMRSAMLQKFR
eukprot:12402750-Karenia_brevis.AAC.1